MIDVALTLYFILLIAMFFVEVPMFLLIILGLSTVLFVSYYFFDNEGGEVQQNYTFKSFIISILLSIVIVLGLGILQSVIIGYDPTESLDYQVFKLYVILCPFALNTGIVRILLINNNRYKNRR